MTAREDSELPLIGPLSQESGLCGGPGQLSCDEANELIQYYFDEFADAESRAKLAEHLGDCSPCESEAAVYGKIIASLSRCRPHLPPDTAARLQQYCVELCDGRHDADPVD